jgi:DNA (cytosine-5)-methyltransferase 1
LTRDALNAAGKPWVIENVGDAVPWLRSPVMLCGAMFGLHTYRHRWFETGCGFTFTAPEHPVHQAATVKMGRPLRKGDWYHAVGNFSGVKYVREDLRVPWMNRDGIRECIPPVYAQYIGTQFEKWRAGQ